MPKISQLISATDVTANDLIQIVDVEDGGMAPSGTNKKVTASLLAKELAKQPLEPGVVISGSSSSDAVRITQTGTGNALVVEDSTNPDSTPFVVTASGDVGIGTNNPGSKLEVNGNVASKTSSQFGGVAVRNANSTVGYIIGTSATNDDGRFGLLSNNVDKVSIQANGDSYFKGGKVGIGANVSLVDTLTVDGPICIRPDTTDWGSDVVELQNRTNTYLTLSGSPNQNDWAYLRQIGTGANDLTIALDLHDDQNNPEGGQAFAIRQAGGAVTPDSITTNFIVDKNGNVGIGTDNPVNFNVNAKTLHIKGTTDVAILRLETNNVHGDLFSSQDSVVLRAATDHPLTFATNGLERMRVGNNGNVGIGVLNPQYQLQLGLDSAAKPSTSTWTVSSDERLKENIEAADLDICYNAVKNIPLKRYKWKDEMYSDEQVSDRSKIGWIAQDVQAVFPKAVGQHKFVYNQVKDDDGNIVSEDSIDNCLSLNSDQLYAAMFGAVQKLIITIETLQDRVNQLEQA